MEKHYILNHLICEGGFGVVYNGYKKDGNKEVVIKSVDKKIMGRNYSKEINFISKLKHHENIVKIIDYFVTHEKIVLAFEKNYGMMDLFEYINNEVNLNETPARKIFVQILNGIKQCTEEGVLHGDIKEENGFIHRENFSVKLIDFGCSSHYTQGFYTHYEGTNVYAPPDWELIRKYTASGLNILCLGVLLYTMLNRYIPFNESEYKWELKWITPLSKEARNLIERMLEKNYTERISLQSVKGHEWMNTN